MFIDQCAIPYKMYGITGQCTRKYSSAQEDTHSYSPSWIPSASESTVPVATRSAVDANFEHQSEAELKTLPYWGRHHVYSGGGYVMDLGNTLSDAEEVVTAAKQRNWIDEYTRAVFAEFNVWNANTNLFDMIIVVFEIQTTGLVTTSHVVDVIELYRYTGAGGVVHLLAEILLLIFVIVKTVIEIRQIVRTRCAHLSSLANVNMLLALVLYYAACGWYICRSALTVDTIEYMMNNRGQCWLRTCILLNLHIYKHCHITLRHLRNVIA